MAIIPKIAAITVLYNPQPDVLSHISTYSRYVDLLVVVDNSDVEGSTAFHTDEITANQIEAIRYNRNNGIAKALNDGIKKAISLNAEWILTMDQDSFFFEEDIRRYLSLIPELIAKGISVVGPNHDSIYSSAGCTEVDSVITSGCLYHKNVFESTGGYDESLFIDQVDHEFCYYAKSMGFRIQQCGNIKLQHQLGESRVVRSISGSASARTFHSPQRLYFMVRNGVYIFKKYQSLFPGSIKKERRDLINRIKNHILYSPKRFKYIRMIIQGYCDGKKGKMGNPFEKNQPSINSQTH